MCRLSFLAAGLIQPFVIARQRALSVERYGFCASIRSKWPDYYGDRDLQRVWQEMNDPSSAPREGCTHIVLGETPRRAQILVRHLSQNAESHPSKRREVS
jgi:hypothetical protein